MDPALLATLGMLGGAALGILGTVFGQNQASHASARLYERQRKDRLRDELVDAVNALNVAAERAHVVADQDPNEEQRREASSPLWAGLKRLSMACSPELRSLQTTTAPFSTSASSAPRPGGCTTAARSVRAPRLVAPPESGRWLLPNLPEWS